MDTGKRSNIEAILPLTELQQGMLIHHLSNPLQDEGFLHVGFRLKGSLNIKYFRKAWELAVERHQVLRSSVHWENIRAPVQLIRGVNETNWTILDWTDINLTEQSIRIEALKSTQKGLGMDFKQNPLLNFHLIKMGNDEFFFLWPCHHLLLDGWSSSNIVKDVCSFYEALCKGTSTELKTLPSLKTYYAWLKNKEQKGAASFWSNYFEGYSKSHLFTRVNVPTRSDGNIMEFISLSETESKKITEKARANFVSVNTLIQGAWSLLLSAYFNAGNVVFGTSVSGRSNDFPNMDLLTGMFMNILPVSSIIDKHCSLKDWLQSFQKRQVACLQYEETTATEILSQLSKNKGGALFDSLLVFENFPWKDLKCGDVEISDYGSGVTSNYPITLIIVPQAQIKFKFIFSTDQLDERTKNWIISNWTRVLKLILSEEVSHVHEVLDGVEIYHHDDSEQKGIKTPKIEALSVNYVAPRNEIEHQLVNIWENLFGIDKVGVKDNYFELGGKSIMAIQMFALIESKLGARLPLTTLLFSPTIEQIGVLLTKKNKSELRNWKFIVPLRTNGSEKPLFCVHGGEGHVLFYKLLPKYLGRDRPVYLLQPKGIDGEGTMHESIEAMSREYLSEILEIQGDGPYNIMFFCYSALAIEMALLLQGMGKQVNLIIVDSTAQSPAKVSQRSFRLRVKNYLLKIRHAPIMTLKSSIVYRYRQLLEPIYIALTQDKSTVTLTKIRKHLDYVHGQYVWKKIDSPITLVLTEKEPTENREEKIRLWEYWTNSKVKVYYNTGNHLNLFDEPHVRLLAKTVDEVCV